MFKSAELDKLIKAASGSLLDAGDYGGQALDTKEECMAFAKSYLSEFTDGTGFEMLSYRLQGVFNLRVYEAIQYLLSQRLAEKDIRFKLRALVENFVDLVREDVSSN